MERFFRKDTLKSASLSAHGRRGRAVPGFSFLWMLDTKPQCGWQHSGAHTPHWWQHPPRVRCSLQNQKLLQVHLADLGVKLIPDLPVATYSLLTSHNLQLSGCYIFFLGVQQLPWSVQSHFCMSTKDLHPPTFQDQLFNSWVFPAWLISGLKFSLHQT